MIDTIHIYSIDSLRDFDNHFSLIELIGSDYVNVVPDVIIERDYIDAGGAIDHMSYSAFTFWQRGNTIYYLVDLNGYDTRITPPMDIAVHLAVHVCKMCDLFEEADLRYTHVFTCFDEENSTRTRHFIREVTRVLEVPVSYKHRSQWREDDLMNRIAEYMRIKTSYLASTSKNKRYNMNKVSYSLLDIFRELESRCDALELFEDDFDLGDDE